MHQFFVPTLALLSLVSAHPGALKPSKDGGRCGSKFGSFCPASCCSAGGYCGTTSEYCSVPGNCQEAFGWCDSYITPSGLDFSHDNRKFDISIPAKIDKCTVPKTLALTFDDGPSNFTDTVLDILQKHDARATFFVAGVNNGHGQLDVKWSSTLQRMALAGHQIGSHTWSHPVLDDISSAERQVQMHKTERSIVNVIGKMPTFMRPPRVICGDMCMLDMRLLGYHVVGWQVDSEDWHEPQPPVQETVDRLANEMNKRDNMFLIQHDTSSTSVEVLKSVLENMPKDWKAVPLVECLGHSLNDAFQYPEWLEYNGAVPGGCLSTSPGSCLPSKPFHGKGECVNTVADMRLHAQDCHDSATSDPRDCHRLDMIAQATMKFCEQCKGDAKCDGDHLTFKGLQSM